MTISSSPGDAQVYLKTSDKLIGTTPVKVNLVANEKELVVRKSGFFSKTVVLSPIDPKNVTVELSRRDRVLVLSPRPATVSDEFKTNLPRPRPAGVEYSEPFGQLAYNIRQSITD